MTSPLSRTRYIAVQHDGTFKLAKLTDTGASILVQTAKREAEGSTPRIFCTYATNGLPADLNASICASILNMRFAPVVDQREAARKYYAEVLERSRALVMKAELLTPAQPDTIPSKHDAGIRFQSIMKGQRS